MQYRNVPTDTKKRISNYFEHKYNQGRFFDETEIMSVIGKPLRSVSLRWGIISDHRKCPSELTFVVHQG